MKIGDEISMLPVLDIEMVIQKIEKEGIKYENSIFSKCG